MSFWSVLAGPILEIIGKAIPDKQAAAAAQLEVLRLQQSGEFKEIDANLQVALAQIAVNQTDAASSDFFRGGWRPAVGWCGVVGLLYTYLAQPMLAWGSGIWNVPAPPSLDLGDLLTLLAGLLGLSGMRTFERIKGKA